MGEEGRSPVPAPETATRAPGFPEFVEALHDHAWRADLGLFISDAEARLLLANPRWASDYFRQWNGEAVEPERGAPIAVPRTETGPVGVVALRTASHEPPAPVVHASELPRRGPSRLAVLVATAVVLAGFGVGLLVVSLTMPPSPGAVSADGTDPLGELPTLSLPEDGAAGASSGVADVAADTAAAQDRLIDDVTTALRLDAGSTGQVPGLDSAIRSQLLRTADLACLQGVDDELAAEIAASVAGAAELDVESGTAVATAIRTYCES